MSAAGSDGHAPPLSMRLHSSGAPQTMKASALSCDTAPQPACTYVCDDKKHLGRHGAAEPKDVLVRLIGHSKLPVRDPALQGQ